MNTIVQISAGLAPVEALRFVDLLAERFIARAIGEGAEARRISAKRSLTRIEVRGLTPASTEAFFGLAGTHVLHAAERGRGARKRWFVGVLVWRPTSAAWELKEEDVELSLSRAGGPGGQHVNTTASAVRAVHRPTGVSVRVQSQRSQHRNRAEALRLLAAKLAAQSEGAVLKEAAAMRRRGFAFERGNAVCAYVMEGRRLRLLPSPKDPTP